MAGASQYMFGSGLVYGTRNDTTGNTPRLFGTLQDVSIDFDGEIKDLLARDVCSGRCSDDRAPLLPLMCCSPRPCCLGYPK